MYTWFCSNGGSVLDPFAGGSVRGITASVLGRKYTGVDLLEDQVEANEVQAKRIIPGNPPTWVTGDSRNVLDLVGEKFDFLFSCPPYFNLEVYSDDPNDLSTLGSYNKFLTDYRDIINKSLSLLRNNRFACFVVANVRNKKTGFYHDLVGDTIRAFRESGADFYNDAVLVTAVGSLPIRTSKQFPPGRKLGKTHQNVLVFVKGDWKKASENCGEMMSPLEVFQGQLV